MLEVSTTSFQPPERPRIQTAPTLHREKLATLMTWKFQSFKKVNLLAAESYLSSFAGLAEA
jgi:hypothetical protein